MKNQYVGDINDYRKYGLIRAILDISRDLNLKYVWMLTPNDIGPDGRFRAYLGNPRRGIHLCCRALFELMQEFNNPNNRNVEFVGKSNIFPQERANFFSQHVRDGADRAAWFGELLQNFGESDLVFFDPDNGLEVERFNDLRKYVLFEEIQETLRNGSSVLFYQHLRQRLRDADVCDYINLKIRRLNLDPEILPIVFRAKRVLFFLLVQPHHEGLSDIENLEHAIGEWSRRNQILLVQ